MSQPVQAQFRLTVIDGGSGATFAVVEIEAAKPIASIDRKKTV